MTYLSTLERIEHDIDNAMLRLATKPVTENFGQKEVKKLQSKYAFFLQDFFSPDAAKGRQLLSDFNNWCLMFTGQEVAYA